MTATIIGSLALSGHCIHQHQALTFTDFTHTLDALLSSLFLLHEVKVGKYLAPDRLNEKKQFPSRVR